MAFNFVAEAAPVARAQTAGKRRQEIELLRVLGAFGIVWFHTTQIGGTVAYSGLVAFLIISMFFAAQSGTPRKSLAQRARSLLLPWLIWFVFYGVLNLTQHKPFMSLENGWIAGLLMGTSVHLWYLPFIFLCILLFDRIKDNVNQYTLSCACVVLAAVILMSWPFWRERSFAFSYPYAQYAHALDGVLIGVFFANCSALSRRTVAVLVGLVLLLCVAALPSPGLGVPYLVGVLVTALALLPRWEIPAWFDISWLSECTFGIYLSHILWLKLLKRILPVPELLMPFAVFLVAAGMVLFFKKYCPSLARYVV